MGQRASRESGRGDYLVQHALRMGHNWIAFKFVEGGEMSKYMVLLLGLCLAACGGAPNGPRIEQQVDSATIVHTTEDAGTIQNDSGAVEADSATADAGSDSATEDAQADAGPIVTCAVNSTPWQCGTYYDMAWVPAPNVVCRCYATTGDNNGLVQCINTSLGKVVDLAPCQTGNLCAVVLGGVYHWGTCQ